MNAGEIVLLLFGLLFLLGGYRLYLAIIAAIGFILGALIESNPFLVETLHDLPTSGSCNSLTPFFLSDIQLLHDCSPQSRQVAVAA